MSSKRVVLLNDFVLSEIALMVKIICMNMKKGEEWFMWNSILMDDHCQCFFTFLSQENGNYMIATNCNMDDDTNFVSHHSYDGEYMMDDVLNIDIFDNMWSISMDHVKRSYVQYLKKQT